ncbi:MAG: sugar phosphate isomerase/epimerase family protein [Capsulimonas sp.]|uniref:sugar phosphate isomerase/epimerase family protein n=1 Tax=Capsulimonas sp. TaxID=2494211 RepID=UPI0032673E3C
MQISIADWCFFRADDTPEAYYQQLAALGVSAVEMATPEHWPAARAAGLSLLNIGAPGMEHGLSKHANHPTLLLAIRETIAAAGANGIPQVIIFSGNRQGQSDADGLQAAIDGVRQLAPDAEAAGVTLVLEILNSHDHTDYQADHSAYGFDLVRAINSPNVKTLYDIYHLHRMGEALLPTILENLDLIAHFHVAGSPARDCPKADGAIDYPTIMREVTSAGYRGYWGLEFLPKGDRWAEIGAARDLLAM